MKKAVGLFVVMMAFLAWVLVLTMAGDADARRGGGGHGGGGHHVTGGHHGGHHGGYHHGGHHKGSHHGGHHHRYRHGGYYAGGGTVIIDDDGPSVDENCVWTGYRWRCYH
jgi:hypothetical protein